MYDYSRSLTKFKLSILICHLTSLELILLSTIRGLHLRVADDATKVDGCRL